MPSTAKIFVLCLIHEECQAWLDHRVFKHQIDEVWAPFPLGRESKKPCLWMDDFSVYILISCCDLIKGCGTEGDYILGDYTSRLQVMDMSVDQPFKDYIRQAYDYFMIGNTNNRKVQRKDIVEQIEIGWGKWNVEATPQMLSMIWIRLVASNIQNEMNHMNF